MNLFFVSFDNFNNSYEKLLQEINQPSLRARGINDMLILVFLALNNAAPSYISDLFTERQTSISLRSKRRLVIPRVNTTNYGEIIDFWLIRSLVDPTLAAFIVCGPVAVSVTH